MSIAVYCHFISRHFIITFTIYYYFLPKHSNLPKPKDKQYHKVVLKTNSFTQKRSFFSLLLCREGIDSRFAFYIFPYSFRNKRNMNKKMFCYF